MIVAGIITFLVGIVSGLLSLMPDMKIDTSPQFQDSFTSVLTGVGAFVPVTHLFIILGLIALVYSAEFFWHLLNWLIAKIPTIE